MASDECKQVLTLLEELTSVLYSGREMALFITAVYFFGRTSDSAIEKELDREHMDNFQKQSYKVCC